MKKWLFFFVSFLFFIPYLISKEDSRKQTICLNMIVKNESQIIGGCLESVKGFIDRWVIVDTGSTDGTQKIIQECLKEIPGELYERPWVNFSHNRNEALELAKGKSDYVLFIDADERLIFSFDFKKPIFDQDCYVITTVDNDSALSSSKFFMINMERDWKWFGVIHEGLESSSAKTMESIKGVTCQRNTNTSARSQDPEKYQKDAKLLEEALKTDPNNSRSVFYLAQSYGNANEYAKALQNYEKRALMGGLEDEVFWSLRMVAWLQKKMDYPNEEVLKSYKKCSALFPSRAEPLFYLGQYFIEHKEYVSAYALLRIALPLEYKGYGYYDSFIYEYGVKYLYARSAQEMKKYEEAAFWYKEVLKKNLPTDIKITAERLLRTCEALKEEIN